MSDKISANLVDDPASPAVNAWVLSLIGFGNQHSRAWSVLVIGTLVLIVGWVDFITGTSVSLGLFYLVPIVLSALWLGWRWGCIVSVTSVIVRVGGDLIYGGDRTSSMTLFWSRATYLGLYLIFVCILHALISLQRQLEQRVKQRTAALAEALRARDELQRQLFDTGSRERSSIGHELHDGLGQHLTATSLAAKMLSSELESTAHPAAADARMVVRMTQDCIAQTRQLARGLLLAAVRPDQLVAELEELCGELQEEYGIGCRFIHTGDPSGLDVTRASHLFYIAREATRNALRHAQASQIEIKLTSQPDRLELTVTDDGLGPPAPGSKLTGMGLRIMAHRSELIGGEFSIVPGFATGARVTCRLALLSDNGPL